MPARVPTGIPGLDSLLQGGFPQGSAVLVTGATGTCKTILAGQFLWTGLQKGETAVFVSLEESADEIRVDMLQFGWDLAAMESRGLFKLIYHDPAQLGNLCPLLARELSSLKASRLVIDSTALIGLTVENHSQIRRRLLALVNTVKQLNCTALLISEVPEHAHALSRFGVEEFVADGVIQLSYEHGKRSLEIRKMRRTKHGTAIYPFELTDHGLVLRKP